MSRTVSVQTTGRQGDLGNSSSLWFESVEVDLTGHFANTVLGIAEQVLLDLAELVK